MASILIVDDDFEGAAAVAEHLVAKGNEVRVAHDGQDGLRKLAARVPDVILLDVDMPILNGPAMVYRMHLIGGGLELIPIVLFSATHDLAATAAQIGTPYFTAKPSSPETLMRVLERALSTRTPPKPRWSF